MHDGPHCPRFIFPSGQIDLVHVSLGPLKGGETRRGESGSNDIYPNLFSYQIYRIIDKKNKNFINIRIYIQQEK